MRGISKSNRYGMRTKGKTYDLFNPMMSTFMPGHVLGYDYLGDDGEVHNAFYLTFEIRKDKKLSKHLIL